MNTTRTTQTKIVDIPALPHLTERQHKALAFIAEFRERYDCYPTTQELCDALGLYSKSPAWNILNRLTEKGLLERGKLTPRGYRGARRMRVTQLGRLVLDVLDQPE